MMLTALISIMSLHIILALVLVLLVCGGNSAIGHAQSRMRWNWFFNLETV